MFLNPLYIIIIVLIIFIIVLFFHKSSIDQKRNNQSYFVPLKNIVDQRKYIEEFTENTSTTSKYNPLFGGKEIGFKAVKEGEKMNFFVYTVNYNNNNLMEYDIIKNTKDIDSNFISFNNNKIGEVPIDKPTSIRTCLTNNKNYITSYDKNSVYIVDTSDILKSTEKTIIQTGKGPTYIDLYRPDDKNIYGYTSNYNDDTVSILNLTTNEKIDDIKVGKNPSFVCVAEKKKILFVANYTDNNISCFKLDESGKTTKISDYPTGKGPTCIEIKPNESKIYVTNYEDGTISIFNINEDNKISQDKPVEIPNNAKPYSIDFNTKNSTGAVLTDNGIYLIDTANKNKLTPFNLSDEESKDIGTITSVRYRYYEKEGKKYEYVFIQSNNGKLFRKKIMEGDDTKTDAAEPVADAADPADKETFNNFEPLNNFKTFLNYAPF